MAHVVKSGYLKRYSRKFMNDGWKDVWVVLHSDSTLTWYKSKGDVSRKGQANMKAVSNFFAVGQYAKNVPGLPPLPAGSIIDHIIAIPEAARRDARVEFLLASNDQDLASWMNAIASTVSVAGLPPAETAPSPHHFPVAGAPGAMPQPGYPGYPQASYPQQGYPQASYAQPAYQQPAYQQPPSYGFSATPQPQAYVQSQPYPVQSAVYAYPGQAYHPAQPVVYAGASPQHTVVVRDHGSSGVLAGGTAGLVGGLAAGYLMGSALGGHHCHYGGLGMGHHWGSWSSMSSFGSFGSWSD